MPSVQTLSNGITSSKPENEVPCPHAITDCPALSFFTMACYAQVTVQVAITTCHGMDTLMPYGKAYRTKSSFLRIFDPHFGPAEKKLPLRFVLADWLFEPLVPC